MAFNKCVICKKPKGTCKHTSSEVAQKEKWAKKLDYWTTGWSIGLLKKSGQGPPNPEVGAGTNQAPLLTTTFDKLISNGDEMSVLWPLSSQDEAVAKVAFDQDAELEKATIEAAAGDLITTGEIQVGTIEVGSDQWLKWTLPNIEDANFPNPLMAAHSWQNILEIQKEWNKANTQAISRVTRSTQESVELIISGLTPEEAEELMMKYKPSPKVLVAKSVMKDAPTHNSKYQPICIWQTESSTKPAFGPAALYSTQLNTDGTLSCNCQGWTRGSAKNPNGRFCKHTKMYADKAAEVFKKWQKGLPLGDEFQAMDEETAKQYGQPASSGEKLLVAKRVIEL